MIETKLVQYLSADTALKALAPGGVWADEFPRGTVFPAVLVAQNAESDLSGVQGRLSEGYKMLIKAVTPGGSFVAAGAIAARIDVLVLALPRASGYIASTRISRVRYVERDGDNRINHLGGLYKVVTEGDV